MSSRNQLAAERLRTALALTDLAEEMLAQRLRRQEPTLTEAQIRRRITEWYEDRPGAPFGDAVGTPGRWPRQP